MARKIAIANQKGGVGKTTTALCLGAALQLAKKKTLIVDLDAQGNASAALGLIIEQDVSTLKDLLASRGDPEDYIVSTESADIIPSNNSLKDIEPELNVGEKFGRLKKCLAPLDDLYDFILFDCPPSFNAFTKNGLVAADEYLVPVDVGYFAILGLKQLLEEVERLKKDLNPGLRLTGVLASKFDKRTSLSKQVLDTLKKSFPDTFFNTAIRANIDLVKAQIANQSIFAISPYCAGARDFRALAKEILNGE